MFNLFWNILILAAGCFACTCAGAAVCCRAAGADFVRKNFDRVETLCVEFLAGSGVLGTVWLIIALLPGRLLGLTAVIIICAAAVFFGGKTAWRDIKLAWTHIRIIVTQPQREMNISARVLQWLILAGLGVMLFASLLAPNGYSSVGEFLIAKQVAFNNTLTAAPGNGPFAFGGLLNEMNIAALMLFGKTAPAYLFGFVCMLAGLMLASGVGRRAGLNYTQRWILVLLLTAGVWLAMQRQMGFDAMESCGMALASLVVISGSSRDDRGTHLLAGGLLGWAIMSQYMQAVVLLPAVVSFAMSIFSKPAENGQDTEISQPHVLRRLGWLFTPVAALLVLWMLKNLVVYGVAIPAAPDDLFSTDSILPLTVLPVVLLLIIGLKFTGEKPFHIINTDFGNLLSLVSLLAACTVLTVCLAEIIDGVSGYAALDHTWFGGNKSEIKFASMLNEKADPIKEKVFIVSPYRYFLDNRLIASSSDLALLRQLRAMSEADKWRQLWKMGYRWVYIGPQNGTFNRDGSNFVLNAELDGETFMLDSGRMPPELGVDPLCMNKNGQTYTNGVYKIVNRENAIIPDDLMPVKN